MTGGVGRRASLDDVCLVSLQSCDGRILPPWSAAVAADGGCRPLCVGRVVYDTPRAALMELTDYVRFESVAIQVLRVRHPELQITAPTADLRRDAYLRPLFGERDEIVGLFSCERNWRSKLKRDLQPYCQRPAEEKPEEVLFVTNQPITEVSKESSSRRCMSAIKSG